MGGMTRLLLLLWAGVTVGSVVELQKRILGGHECRDNERLYHVQLRTNSPDGFVCGGSLISDRWILTAAHCWDLSLYAVVGVHPGPGTGTHPDNHVKVKPHFFWDEDNRIHDIMLLEIINHKPTGIRPVKLPDKCGNPPKTVQIAGHARTTVDTKNIKGTVESGKLLCVDSDVASCEPLRRCIKNNNPRQSIDRINEHWLCYQRAGVDTSRGDSGGGVVDNGVIYGVHVLGSNRACSMASASMEVCKYRDWIDKTTTLSIREKCAKGVKKLCCRS